jgi:sulfur-oxidizing protein SoxY
VSLFHRPHRPHRRALIGQGFALAAAGLWLRPAQADAPELAAALRAWAGQAPVRPGRVTLDVATLVENGNSVDLTVRVDSPMTAADHVTAIALFNERNPQRDVATFTLGPRSGRAQVSTRIRLATSQQLVALARLSDGSVWSHTVDVVVTLAACIEGE